jgi:hypothetical protein
MTKSAISARFIKLNLLSGVLFAAACLTEAPPVVSDASPARRRSFEIEIAQRYGWSDLKDSTRGLTETERMHSAGVIGRTAAIAEDKDGRVFVLDGDLKKIVIFDRDGTFRALIPGGYGRGPGEFVSARALALGPPGSVFVLDESLLRVTEFSIDSGTYRRDFRVPVSNPTQMRYSDGKLYILRPAAEAADRRAITILDAETGSAQGSAALFAEQDRNLTAFGGFGMLGATPDQQVLVAMPAPSRWMAITDTSETVYGDHLFPASRGLFTRRLRRNGETGPTVRSVPEQGLGVAGMVDGRTVVYYMVRNDIDRETGIVTPRPDASQILLDVYSPPPDRVYLGSAQLVMDSVNVWGHLTPTHTPGELLFSNFGLTPGATRVRLVNTNGATGG